MFDSQENSVLSPTSVNMSGLFCKNQLFQGEIPSCQPMTTFHFRAIFNTTNSTFQLVLRSLPPHLFCSFLVALWISLSGIVWSLCADPRPPYIFLTLNFDDIFDKARQKQDKIKRPIHCATGGQNIPKTRQKQAKIRRFWRCFSIQKRYTPTTRLPSISN